VATLTEHQDQPRKYVEILRRHAKKLYAKGICFLMRGNAFGAKVAGLVDPNLDLDGRAAINAKSLRECNLESIQRNVYRVRFPVLTATLDFDNALHRESWFGATFVPSVWHHGVLIPKKQLDVSVTIACSPEHGLESQLA
jgi:hypothetical protein